MPDETTMTAVAFKAYASPYGIEVKSTTTMVLLPKGPGEFWGRDSDGSWFRYPVEFQHTVKGAL